MTMTMIMMLIIVAHENKNGDAVLPKKKCVMIVCLGSGKAPKSRQDKTKQRDEFASHEGA